MSTTPVWVISLTSGITSGGVAVTVCALIERYGGALGGVLGTMPGTITPASLGLWYARSSLASFRMSLASAPIGLGVNALFLMTWRYGPSFLPVGTSLRRLMAMVVISLFTWTALAVPAMFMVHNAQQQMRERMVYVAGLVSAFMVFGIGLAGTWSLKPRSTGLKQVGWPTQCARGLLAFAAVSSAVFVSHLIPAIGGLMVVWPAVMLTTMVALWLAHGETVPSTAASSMVLGLAAPMLFCGLACVLYPVMGATIGCMTSWVLSVCLGTVPLAWYVRWRESHDLDGCASANDTQLVLKDRWDAEMMMRDYETGVEVTPDG